MIFPSLRVFPIYMPIKKALKTASLTLFYVFDVRYCTSMYGSVQEISEANVDVKRLIKGPSIKK